MGALLDKLRGGERWTPDEAIEFLVAFHAARPGATSRSLARRWGSNATTSYDLTAQRMPAGARVALDLACGDGELSLAVARRLGDQGEIIGIDVCATDLELARPRLEGFCARLLCERAEQLSLATASVDVAFCHFALMLMSPLTPVVIEVARILVPGGLFVACVPGGSLEGLSAPARDLVLDTIRGDLPTYPDTGLGDARVNDDQVIASLFKDSGFATVTVDKHVSEGENPPEQVLAEMRDYYWWDMIHDGSRARLERDLPALLRASAEPSGMLRRISTLRFIEARRA